MIRFENVTKSFRLRDGSVRNLVAGLTMEIPRQNLAILGRNGMGKSTMLRMIAGLEGTTDGRILRDVNVSWPIGFRGSFHRELTGLENVRFVSRIYGQNTSGVVEFVRDFAELGRFFDEPVKTYSSGMVARLAFGVSMAVRFEVYLVDELLGVGDANFRQKCLRSFKDRMSDAKVIMVSHQMETLKEYCEAGLVLHDGQLTYCPDLSEAIELYKRHNAPKPRQPAPQATA